MRRWIWGLRGRIRGLSELLWRLDVLGLSKLEALGLDGLLLLGLLERISL